MTRPVEAGIGEKDRSAMAEVKLRGCGRCGLLASSRPPFGG